MTRLHLSNDEFFQKLAALFSSHQGKDNGTVSLTQKRLAYDPSNSIPKDLKPTSNLLQSSTIPPPSAPVPVLIRASNGQDDDKNKISTVVQPEQLDAFFVRYAEVCRAGMTSLKKRDRSKRKKKTKAKSGTATAT